MLNSACYAFEPFCMEHTYMLCALRVLELLILLIYLAIRSFRAVSVAYKGKSNQLVYPKHGKQRIVDVFQKRLQYNL